MPWFTPLLFEALRYHGLGIRPGNGGAFPQSRIHDYAKVLGTYPSRKVLALKALPGRDREAECETVLKDRLHPQIGTLFRLSLPGVCA
jgi:hypothetical protein